MWVTGNMPPIILNLGTTWGVISQHPDRFTPGNNPPGHTDKKAVRARVGLDATEKRQVFAHAGILTTIPRLSSL
jgi:hypothetical protein